MLATALLFTLALQQPSAITLKRAWVRGDDADTLVSFSRLTPSMVSGGPDNRVYILDVDRGRVVILDQKGRTLKPLGRKGGGPGELSNPVSLVVSPSGNVYVWDFARRGFVGWSGKGAVLSGNLPFERPGIPNNPQALSDSLFFFQTITPDSVRLIRYTPTGWSVAQARSLPEPKLIAKNVCDLFEYRMPPLFTPSLVWANWGPDIVSSYGSEFTVEIGASTANARTFSAPAKPRRTTRQMAIDQLGPSRVVVQGRPACNVPAERVIDAVGMAAELPAYQRLIAVSPTTLWAVRLALKGEATTADIYDRKTGYRGSIALGSARPVAFLANGTLLSLETNEDDVPLIVAYTVSGSR